jgi:cysteine synthase
MQMETDFADANPDWFSVNQYDNLANPEAHFKTTGPEIFQQTCGTVTHFVMAGSTGGTISGVGGYLKRVKPSVKVSFSFLLPYILPPMWPLCTERNVCFVH